MIERRSWATRRARPAMMDAVDDDIYEESGRSDPRGGPDGEDGPLPPRPYEVVVYPGGRCVEAWSTKRLPFEPKGWLLSLRAELRGAVSSLHNAPDSVLAAMYGSPEAGACDVENVLLYNVGPRAFAVIAAHGLRLERSYICPEPPVALDGVARHYVRYAPSPVTAGFEAWTRGSVLAEWSRIPMPELTEATKPARVWYAMAKAEIDVATTVEDQQPFGLCLLLEVPPGGRIAPAKIVKPLIDGTIAALHCHDGSTLAELSRRLSAQISVHPETIGMMLVDDRSAVLGPRRLLWARAESVQWNPADDRCLAVEVLVRGSDRLALSGCLTTVTPSCWRRPDSVKAD